MIEVRNLTKYYGNFAAVNDVSFDAHSGEIVGLLGPNGAGKTSTMRMLTGFMPPSGGYAKVAGYDTFKESIEVRRRVGYLPENVPVYPDMTVRDYVMFWAKLRRVAKPKQQVDAALERVQLTDRRNTLVRNLSKGLKQRLGLAQALVHNPEVIILDEPTIGIDPQQVIEVRNTVKELGQDHTVLFSTHILAEAEQVCDRILIINNGHIVASGEPAALRQQIQPGVQLYILLGKHTPGKVQQLFKAIEGVKHIEQQGDGYVLDVEPGHDVRADIATQIVEAGYALLEMRPLAMTLEDIFLNIISDKDYA
ncbi:MAG: ABC transporter ATP-binding protein [Chloroflexi bacterium]|nr:MAG: MFS transporter [Phototrophicales bacterium]RMF80365.1 MAG: ABC transporter ATP-binding protein [Chloroflexota bacterium]